METDRSACDSLDPAGYCSDDMPYMEKVVQKGSPSDGAFSHRRVRDHGNPRAGAYINIWKSGER